MKERAKNNKQLQHQRRREKKFYKTGTCSLGVPMVSKILLSWSISYWPGNSGFRKNSSAKIQPQDLLKMLLNFLSSSPTKRPNKQVRLTLASLASQV
jgi:hypothetical protein